MKLIKTSLHVIKNNWASLFLFQFLFIFANFFFLFFLKKKMQSYLEAIQAISPSLQAVENAAGQAAKNVQLDSLLKQIAPPTQNTLLLVFILTPVVLISLWVFFQGMIWKTMRQDKVKETQRYFISISTATISTFFLLLVLIRLNLQSILINALFIFILYYLLTLYYLSAGRNSIAKTAAATLSTALKKFPQCAPYIFLLFLTSLGQLFLLLILHLSYSLQDFFFIPPVTLILYMCLCFVVNLFLKAVVAARTHTLNAKHNI